jgi:AcrR family transcriptional regulator
MLSKARRDKDARREAILDVAEEVFLEEGFAAASMSTIAARLGGSKGTLYNYFKSKDELFEAYVLRRCALNLEEIYAPSYDGETVAEALTRLGRAYLRRILADENLRPIRVITAESQRSPEIGRLFYETGPGGGARRLAQRIEEWMAEGELRRADAQIAAYQFIGLCQNRYFKERLFNYTPELTDAQIEAEVAAAVDTFMRAFSLP